MLSTTFIDLSDNEEPAVEDSTIHSDDLIEEESSEESLQESEGRSEQSFAEEHSEFFRG